MFDKELIRKINSGRCFVLVGSGPSCEIGYPSWKVLAEQTYKELIQKGIASDRNSYEKYLQEMKFPELFRLAERDLGSRNNLVKLLRHLINPSKRDTGVIYNLICNWPFACYLTTNFDDEIETSLKKHKQYFKVIRNRRDDFHLFRDGVSNIIQKLHSDLNFPDDVIITSEDYQRLSSMDNGKYFRDKLRQVFEMYDVLIIGHSLSDPDIALVLQNAKNTASPQHPIYMVMADLEEAEEQELFEKYNIELIKYSNHDGRHSELRRILKTIDRFIVSRDRFVESKDYEQRPSEEIEAAMALFLYRRLQGVDALDYLCPLLLMGIDSAEKSISKDEITSTPALKMLINKGVNFNDEINSSLGSLVNQDLVTVVAGKFSITHSGEERVQEYKTIRTNERDQAFGQFRFDLKEIYEDVTKSQLELCQNLAEDVIVNSFKNRGSAIANQIYSGQSANPDELSDVFGYVSEKTSVIDVGELQA